MCSHLVSFSLFTSVFDSFHTTQSRAPFFMKAVRGRSPGGLLPYMGYIEMCRCEEYGFQAVYSRIGVYKSEHLGLE